LPHFNWRTYLALAPLQLPLPACAQTPHLYHTCLHLATHCVHPLPLYHHCCPPPFLPRSLLLPHITSVPSYLPYPLIQTSFRTRLYTGEENATCTPTQILPFDAFKCWHHYVGRARAAAGTGGTAGHVPLPGAFPGQPPPNSTSRHLPPVCPHSVPLWPSRLPAAMACTFHLPPTTLHFGVVAAFSTDSTHLWKNSRLYKRLSVPRRRLLLLTALRIRAAGAAHARTRTHTHAPPHYPIAFTRTQRCVLPSTSYRLNGRLPLPPPPAPASCACA